MDSEDEERKLFVLAKEGKLGILADILYRYSLKLSKKMLFDKMLPESIFNALKTGETKVILSEFGMVRTDIYNAAKRAHCVCIGGRDTELEDYLCVPFFYNSGSWEYLETKIKQEISLLNERGFYIKYIGYFPKENLKHK